LNKKLIFIKVCFFVFLFFCLFVYLFICLIKLDVSQQKIKLAENGPRNHCYLKSNGSENVIIVNKGSQNYHIMTCLSLIKHMLLSADLLSSLWYHNNIPMIFHN
jgi:hypothetical protein